MLFMFLRLWPIILRLGVVSRVAGGPGMGAIIIAIMIVMSVTPGTTIVVATAVSTSSCPAVAKGVMRVTAAGVAATEQAF